MEDRHSTARQATRKPEGKVVVLSESESGGIRTEAVHFVSSGPNEFIDLSQVEACRAFMQRLIDLQST